MNNFQPRGPSPFRGPVEWSESRVFSDGDLRVFVMKSNHPYPQYSLKVCTLRKKFEGYGDNRVEIGENLVPFFNPRVYDQKFGRANMDDSIQRVLTMLSAAGEYIREDAQFEADRLSAAREEQDLAEVNRDKPVTRVTGKTEKRREKIKGGRRDGAPA